MVELLRASDPVLLSALKAALAEARIPVFEFDALVNDLYPGGVFMPRRLMVHEDDLADARDVAAELCPEELPPLAENNRV
jgi:hypothetical protein